MYISQLTIIIVQLTAHNFLLRFTIYNKQFAIYYVQVIIYYYNCYYYILRFTPYDLQFLIKLPLSECDCS